MMSVGADGSVAVFLFERIHGHIIFLRAPGQQALSIDVNPSNIRK